MPPVGGPMRMPVYAAAQPLQQADLPVAGVGLASELFLNKRVAPGEWSISRRVHDAGGPVLMEPDEIEALMTKTP